MLRNCSMCLNLNENLYRELKFQTLNFPPPVTLSSIRPLEGCRSNLLFAIFRGFSLLGKQQTNRSRTIDPQINPKFTCVNIIDTN